MTVRQTRTCACGARIALELELKADRYGNRRLIYSTDCPACGATIVFDFREADR